MLISLNWIKDFVDLPNLPPKELGSLFTLATAEVEDVIVKGDSLKSILCVEIKSLTVDSVKGNLSVENTLTVNTIKVDVLEVRELKTDLKFGQSASLEVTVTGGETLVGC